VRRAYGGILGSFRVAALECDPVALVLETLRSNQTLDTGSLGVWLLALALRLDLTANDELADLAETLVSDSNPYSLLRLSPSREGLAKKL
jgi:hypothetical protein